MSSPSSRNSPTFFRDELKRALEEQTFGIASYTLGHSTAFEASARVTLLEGVEVDIILSIRGFQALHSSSSSTSTSIGSTSSTVSVDPDAYFETVDTLLQHLSPLYAAKRTETLFAKLMA
ncbi:hypothetical protein SCHPADRAFT_903005 [Schizopora paradoxa]|uniref:GSKIP domain-containing protein n=1 Tax=Schizopora paradoxa TaxID=27342 RepID=A0A0H2RYX1_9AGAM|nr:hypothetical protein SCHPADRAFT_903005 [Schizopora paradoxa]